MAGSPIPVAMSSTIEPGLISASSIKRLLTFSAPLSIVFHHFRQLLATLFQDRRSASLYYFGSKVVN